ncbi:MAG: methyltransferase type 11 [Rhizobiales bacterium 65-9]|nr:methyltransferase domain-containing protein [Hyphomicrobiales bacterium]OJY34681.1 MAG: methyltransferase type 11 [Rhizobiales bacterium 65-9]
MPIDVVDLRSFYSTPLGGVTRRVLGQTLRSCWPRARDASIAGVGYATPFLPLWRGEAERLLALMPAAQGVVNWPVDGASATALVDPYEIPLPNASIERVLLAHSLEAVVQPADLLAEIWRILTPGGRMIAIVPNRRGVWASTDATPFGYGQPYSKSQLADLMRGALFSPESWREVLFFPPSHSRLVLRSAGAWEVAGRLLALPFAGVHAVEATKQLYRPALANPRRKGLLMAAPAAAATRSATP